MTRLSDCRMRGAHAVGVVRRTRPGGSVEIVRQPKCSTAWRGAGSPRECTRRQGRPLRARWVG
eukprot:6946655-Prymnesium_polylepis.1